MQTTDEPLVDFPMPEPGGVVTLEREAWYRIPLEQPGSEIRVRLWPGLMFRRPLPEENDPARLVLIGGSPDPEQREAEDG